LLKQKNRTTGLIETDDKVKLQREKKATLVTFKRPLIRGANLVVSREKGLPLAPQGECVPDRWWIARVTSKTQTTEKRVHQRSRNGLSVISALDRATMTSDWRLGREDARP